MKQNKMLKKVIFVLMLLGLVLCVGACSKKPKEGDTNVSAEPTATPEPGEENETPEPDAGEEPTQEPGEETEDGQNTEEAQFLYDGEPIDAAEFRDPFHNIAFDRPMYQVVSEGFTQVFNRAGSLFIAYSMLKEEQSDLTAEDVMESELSDRFFAATDTYYSGYDAQLVMDSSEKIVINGIDCMRFEGAVISEADEKEIKNYAVGYTFVKENIPCLMIGVVVEDDQTQQHIDEVTHNVDEMIKTLRDKE